MDRVNCVYSVRVFLLISGVPGPRFGAATAFVTVADSFGDACVDRLLTKLEAKIEKQISEPSTMVTKAAAVPSLVKFCLETAGTLRGLKSGEHGRGAFRASGTAHWANT
jgi:hypothetical protein